MGFEQSDTRLNNWENTTKNPHGEMGIFNIVFIKEL